MKKIALFLNLFLALSALQNFASSQGLTGNGGMMESTLDRVDLSILSSQKTMKSGDEAVFVIMMDIEEGWHLNANNPTLDYLIGVELRLDSGDVGIVSDIQYPVAIQYEFDFAGDELAVYEGQAPILLKMMTSGDLSLGEYQVSGELDLQACSDSVCLAPETASVELAIIIGEETVLSEEAKQIDELQETGAFETHLAGENLIADLFSERGLIWAFAGIFLIGLALNLTPCVYPMMSVTVSLFSGNQASGTKSRFIGALVYVLGIVSMYSLLGVFAAFTGGLFGSWLQSPVVLGLIGFLLLALSLSLFGLYELQPPAWLMQKMGKTQQIAGLAGLFLSGLLVGVFAAPCIGPPIIALLAFVGAHGSPLFGFFTFFVLALGLGLPYLILGTFSGAIQKLPQSGSWMMWIKKLFGVILIGLALFYLTLAFVPTYSIHVILISLVAGGIYLGLLESSGDKTGAFVWVKRATGIVALGIGLMIFQNLQKESVVWEEYDQERVEQALEEGMPVMIDFYADWCIPCLELDRRTFTDGEVIRQTESFLKMKVDLTHFDSEEAAELRRKYDVAGVPTILFLDRDGEEVADARVVGFEPPDRFLRRISKADDHQ
ncbi:MAG: thioredoxin family protein [Balneolaceae bacterium]|nr:thioredoxin family protein [Balneolaceae bacterium]MCH8548476.1 thioredoxin family protein [Balneolaceae bacterium]